MTTARTTLALLADLIKPSLKPEGRGGATAASFNQIGELAGEIPLTLADAAAGFAVLAAQAKGENEPINVIGRRKTCAEVAALAGDPTGGDVRNLAAVFRAVEKAFAGSTDGRELAMAATAAREAAELEAQ